MTFKSVNPVDGTAFAEVAGVIEDTRVHAVTLAGSEPAGRQVAATAGAQVKKSLLELGGSDPFIVLEDADLDQAVEQAVISRFLNTGQSCIAAKRFIVVEPVAAEFVARFKTAVEAMTVVDPMDEANALGPMARGERISRQLQCGCAFVNGLVKSDPRLPFGGIKNSLRSNSCAPDP